MDFICIYQNSEKVVLNHSVNVERRGVSELAAGAREMCVCVCVCKCVRVSVCGRV